MPFRDFDRLLIVCLKMLFRKTTRKRFVFLVAAFMFMMAFNGYSYVMRFHKSEIQKQDLLNEKAFKVFFLRSRTMADCARFLSQHADKIRGHGAKTLKQSLIYQNNLYIHFYPPFDQNNKDNREALYLLYDLFNIKDVSANIFSEKEPDDHEIRIRAEYFDYNGMLLSDDIVRGRHKAIMRDLTDIADMIREGLSGKRMEVFNLIKGTIVDNIKRVTLDPANEPNPYLSRVEMIVPMNFLYIFDHIRDDTTTDIIDLGESVRYEEETSITSFKPYIEIPHKYEKTLLYEDKNIYPRYIPVYAPDMLKPRWNWMLYEDIDIGSDLLEYIVQLHSKGYYMFSYEKSQILKDKVRKINDDIRSNHIYFYLTDLSIGIVFPFMISLFAFIHLKTEISFLFMFKNRIRELLFIFWMLPVISMLVVKGGILTAYLAYLVSQDLALSTYIIFSLLITFVVASIAFYPINRWCFSQFTSNRLNLYALHKGR
jgi:hypothetical protein